MSCDCRLCDILENKEDIDVRFEDDLITVVECPYCDSLLVIFNKHKSVIDGSVDEYIDDITDSVEHVRNFMYPKHRIQWDIELEGEHWNCHLGAR